MRYVRVQVKRDTQTTYTRDVPEWEIPVLEYIFEDGNVIRSNVFVEAEGDYPEPAAELGRLVSAYGADTKTGVPHVVSVYGEGARGVREIARIINEAKAADAKSAKRAPAGKVRTASHADPLMA